jgi:2-C-methyl-D-erythritol 2,4-cyclodiphosphate synthase
VSFEPTYEYRTGIGTDIHRIVEGRKLMLGGVEVPYPSGLIGHSDGDVALHAIIDAVIGAAGMGDIGTFFPDTEEQWRDADSKELLLVIKDQIADKQWEIVNIDLIIHAEQPKLGVYKGQMKRAIASLLGIDFAAVNIKAKTNEGLGEIGAGLAMAATASVLLRKKVKRTL